MAAVVVAASFLLIATPATTTASSETHGSHAITSVQGAPLTTVNGVLFSAKTTKGATGMTETVTYYVVTPNGIAYTLATTGSTTTSWRNGTEPTTIKALEPALGNKVAITGELSDHKITAANINVSIPTTAEAALLAEREGKAAAEKRIDEGAVKERKEKEDVSVTEEVREFVVSWYQVFFVLLFVVAIVVMLWYFNKKRKISEVSQGGDGATTAVTFADVAGCEEAKEELEEVVKFMRAPEIFKALGAKVPHGVLLFGPPGGGKTMLAKAVANESGANFYSVSGSQFVEMFAGVGSSRVRSLFRRARKKKHILKRDVRDIIKRIAPTGHAIIFIDEFDALGGKRGMDFGREHDQTLNQLLVEMDGFGTDTNVVVMAATNLPDSLDPAVMRAGRFDRHVYVLPPDVKGRRKILDVHTRDKPLGDVNLDKVARQTAGLVGADLANISNEAAILAARGGRTVISQQDFDDALERIIAGSASRKAMKPEERETIAYHEAGHALVAELVPATKGPDKISLVPRGQALGYTMHLPEEDRWLQYDDELRAELAVLLAGRAAEEIVFGRVSNGASNDLERVTRISRAMLEKFAMGEEIATELGDGGRFGATSSYSEHFRRQRDEEQANLLREAKQLATKVITDHRDYLETIAQVLLKQETIEREEIEEILKPAVEASQLVTGGASTSPDGDKPAALRPGPTS
jgi:cell division protease FtsH